VVALALFGLSQSLILYSATGKQYSLDVLATLLIYIAAFRVGDLTSVRWIAVWTLVGAVTIWISFAAVFVFAGISATLIARGAILRRWRVVALHSLAAGTWLASFAALYFVSVVDLSHLERSLHSASAAGAPASGVPRTIAGAIRSDIGIGHLELGGHDLGTVVAGLAIVLAVIGLLALMREKPAAAALLSAPFLLTLIASKFGKYPLFPRTLLFFMPAFVVCIAHGAFSLGARLGYTRNVSIAVMAVVFAFISIPTLTHLAHPQHSSDLRPAMRFLADNQRSVDTLWIYHASQYGFRYYLECKCFGNVQEVRRGSLLWPLHPALGGPGQFAPTLSSAPPRFIVSRSGDESTAYRSELKGLRGRGRVWLLVSDANTDVRSTIFSFASRIGRQQRGRQQPAAVRLYDLRRKD
jgi:hypothetical protein